MPANGRWDLIRRLKVNLTSSAGHFQSSYESVKWVAIRAIQRHAVRLLLCFLITPLNYRSYWKFLFRRIAFYSMICSKCWKWNNAENVSRHRYNRLMYQGTVSPHGTTGYRIKRCLSTLGQPVALSRDCLTTQLQQVTLWRDCLTTQLQQVTV